MFSVIKCTKHGRSTTKQRETTTINNLHESRCSSVLSPQSLSPSHVKLHGIQRPLLHAKSYNDEHDLISTTQRSQEDCMLHGDSPKFDDWHSW